MALDLAVVAGSVSTAVFAGSMLPMVAKAVRTRDLASYSVPSLLLSNAGNVVHSVYVFSLPAGPIWALHSFYLVVTALMLVLALRHPAHARADRTHGSPDVPAPAPFLASEHAGHPGPAGPEDDHDDHDHDHDHDHEPDRRLDHAVRV